MSTKKLLQAAGGAAGGAEPLAIEDVFSTYLYTGNGSSQVIENGINLGQSNAGGSVRFDGDQTDSLSIATNAALDLAPGDFTIEMWVYPNRITNYQVLFDTSLDGSAGANMTEFWINPSGNIEYYAKGSIILTSSATLSANNWYHIALVKSSGTDRLYVNGALSASVSSTTGPNTGYTWYIGNRGPGAVAGQYPLQGNISNFRIVKGVGVYTSAFTPPTSNLTAISGTSLLICQGDNPFVDNSTNAFTITKNGDPQAKSFGPFDAAEAGEGGLVWVKTRAVSDNHSLVDTERGGDFELNSNTTSGQGGGMGFSFNADGFTLGSSIKNANTAPYASWTFRKAPRFFDVVTYTGTGSDQTISHNLGVSPGCIIVKRTNSTDDWYVYHRNLTTATENWIRLNNIGAANGPVGQDLWGPPSDTTFKADTYLGLSTSGATYVAYLFAHDPLGPSGDGSDGLIACGSYTGTGSSSGPRIELGWEPQWILYKAASTTGDWGIHDTMRGLGVSNSATSGTGNRLEPNTSDAETGLSNFANIDPTGFTIKAAVSDINGSNQTYIYIAIRRGPMREPTSGTEVFAVSEPVEAAGVAMVAGSGVVDMVLHRPRITSAESHYVFDRLRGNGRYMSTSSTSAEAYLQWDADSPWWEFDSNNGAINDEPGYYNNSGGYGVPAALYAFKRAPGFFDVVCYTGDGTGARAVPHNLGVTPEWVIFKRRDVAEEWWNYHAGLTSPNANWWTNFLQLEATAAAGSSGSFDAPDADNINLSSNNFFNGSGKQYIVYLFASLPGISKVGSYTGNGSSQTINCGFTGGARFVLIKRTDSTGDWYVWDTARGIVAGTDPHLSLNTTAAEVTTDDSIDPDSSGFIVNQVAPTLINQSSATYIYLAIA